MKARSELLPDENALKIGPMELVAMSKWSMDGVNVVPLRVFASSWFAIEPSLKILKSTNQFGAAAVIGCSKTKLTDTYIPGVKRNREGYRKIPMQ